MHVAFYFAIFIAIATYVASCTDSYVASVNFQDTTKLSIGFHAY